MLGALKKVRGWGYSRECLKIMDEVRLVVIATVERQLYPINSDRLVDCLHHPLKAANATKQLGSQPHLLAE